VVYGLADATAGDSALLSRRIEREFSFTLSLIFLLSSSSFLSFIFSVQLDGGFLYVCTVCMYVCLPSGVVRARIRRPPVVGKRGTTLLWLLYSAAGFSISKKWICSHRERPSPSIFFFFFFFFFFVFFF
jgi:hypothetical protein